MFGKREGIFLGWAPMRFIRSDPIILGERDQGEVYKPEIVPRECRTGKEEDRFPLIPQKPLVPK